MKKAVMKNWLHTIVFCILAIFVSFAIYNIIQELFLHIQTEQRLAETSGRIAASIGIAVFYNKFFDIESFGIKKGNFFQGLIIGGFMILATLNNLAASMLAVSDYPSVMPSVYLIFAVIIEQIFIGVFEEFLFRGLILNIILKKMQEHSFKSKMTAVVISSVLFGVVHLLNLFSAPQLINETIDQVFYAAFIGVFLGALYLRSHNIWVVVFYHAIYDMASELPVIFHEIPAQAIIDETVSEAVLNIIVSSVFIFAGLFIARKPRSRSQKSDNAFY